MRGIKTFSCRCPCIAPVVMATSLPMTWQHTCDRASHWVGFTLPGIMEEPGSLAGSTTSPMPQRGPELSRRKSLAIFISDTARRLRAPDTSASESCEAIASYLLGALVKESPVNWLMYCSASVS